jgi:hypothetical protein
MGRALGLAAVAALVAAGAVVGTTAWAADAPSPLVVTPSTTTPGTSVVVKDDSSPGNDRCGKGPIVGRYAYVVVRPKGNAVSTAASSSSAGDDGQVGPDGHWSATVALPADIAPGDYEVYASCYNAGPTQNPYYSYSDSFAPAALTVSLAKPAAPQVSPAGGVPGTTVTVTGGGTGACPPPPGSAHPRAVVTLDDGAGMVRASALADVAADGSWKATLRVPDLPAQDATVGASCRASDTASAPYATSAAASFTITPPPTTTTATTTVPTTAGTTLPGAVATTTTVVAPTTSTTAKKPSTGVPGVSADLPASPLATPITAEPAYTG